MKTKSIKNLETKYFGGFTKVFGAKIYGGSNTATIKEVVIGVVDGVPQPFDGPTTGGTTTNDGSDGND